jgi:hypothetical protein
LSTNDAATSRQSALAAGWRAYNGKYRRALVNKRGQIDPNVRVNYARVLVDKSVAMLFGKEVSFDVVQDEQNGDSTILRAAQAHLNETWRLNKKMQLLQKAAMNGCVGGDVFLQLVDAKPFPRIVNLDPALVDVETSATDCEDVLAYRLSWDGIDAHGRPVRWQRYWQRLKASWQETLWYSVDGENWQLAEEPNPWQWDFAPIVHWQNLPIPNSYFGMADLSEDVLHLIGRLNLVLSNWMKSVLHHAHPKQWGSGFEADELRTAPDETTVLPSKDARLELLEMKGSVQPMDQLYVRLRDALNEIARLPEIATGKMENIGVLSGLAMNILYQPLLELTSERRVLAGPELEELSQNILTMAGYKGLTVSCEWPELLPGDPTTEGKVLAQDKELGIVSTETISRKRGYDPDKEKARIAREETSQNGTGSKPETVHATGL